MNYALTLGYLGADFYEQVIASGVIEDEKLADLAKKFGQHEQEHVEALLKTAKQSASRPGSRRRTSTPSSRPAR